MPSDIRPKLLGYEISTDAVSRGALVTTVLAVPLGVVAGRVLADGSAWNSAVTIGIFAAFMLGGAVAGRIRPDTPGLHGALAALPCLLLLTFIRLLLALFGDIDFAPNLILSQIVIGTSLATIGGVVAARRADRGHSLVD
ncbi:MAG: hypothetical protein GXP35_00755 [Actinobacteria bacterium]|nr:hypothetical protein [Actinomycetota bacterium]